MNDTLEEKMDGQLMGCQQAYSHQIDEKMEEDRKNLSPKSKNEKKPFYLDRLDRISLDFW